MENEEIFYEYVDEPDTDTLLAQQKQLEDEINSSNQENDEEQIIIEYIEEVPPSTVYIKIDDKNRIIDINNNEFIEDTTNWIEIDKGYGDKYSHAQTQYLPKSLINSDGIYQYKFINNEILERTEEEIQQDKEEIIIPITDQERINQLELENKQLKEEVQTLSEKNTFIEDCLIEMSTIVYA